MSSRVPVGTFEGASVQSLYLEPISIGGARLGGATGFIWRVGEQDYLITNWHVLSGRNSLTGQLNPIGAVPTEIAITFMGSRYDQQDPRRFQLYTNPEAGTGAHWLEHPTFGHRMDVGVLPIDFGPTRPFNARPLVTGLGGYEIEELRPTTDVFAVGYPFGIRPGGFTAVWVRGTVASEPNIDFDDRPCFLIDARTRKGQSGSPVIEYDPNGVVSSPNSLNFHGQPFCRVHGVYSGRTDDQSDLGFVWKREAVQEILIHGTPPSDDLLSGRQWPG